MTRRGNATEKGKEGGKEVNYGSFVKYCVYLWVLWKDQV